MYRAQHILIKFGP